MNQEHCKAFTDFDTAYLQMVAHLVKGDFKTVQDHTVHWTRTKDNCRPLITDCASHGKLDVLQAVHDAITLANRSFGGTSSDLFQNYTRYLAVREKLFSLLAPNFKPSELAAPVSMASGMLATNIDIKQSLDTEKRFSW